MPKYAIARLGTARFRIEGSVTSLAFSPDSKWVAGDSGGLVHLWEAATGKVIRQFDSGSSTKFVQSAKPIAIRQAGQFRFQGVRIHEGFPCFTKS